MKKMLSGSNVHINSISTTFSPTKPDETLECRKKLPSTFSVPDSQYAMIALLSSFLPGCFSNSERMLQAFEHDRFPIFLFHGR